MKMGPVSEVLLELRRRLRRFGRCFRIKYLPLEICGYDQIYANSDWKILQWE